MSISLLCRGYFPLSFTNSDIICSFIAALASPGQPPPGQTILQIAELSETLSEGGRAEGQTLSEILAGRLRVLLEISGNIDPWPQAWSGLAR